MDVSKQGPDSTPVLKGEYKVLGQHGRVPIDRCVQAAKIR
jgi:hypothetical protein